MGNTRNILKTAACTLYIVLCACRMSVFAQEIDIATITQQQLLDSITHVRDSIESALRQQIQDMQLKEIIMQERIALSDRDAMQDSLREANIRSRVDSLRRITHGVPLVIESDTLLMFYTRKGGMLPEQRAETARALIVEAGHSLTVFLDSVYLYDSELQTDIMLGDEVLLSVTDMDALWLSTERLTLAKNYKKIVEKKIQELHDIYGFKQKLKGGALALIVILLQLLAVWITLRLFRRWKRRGVLRLLRKLKPFQTKNYVLLDTHRLGVIIIGVLNLLRFLIILLQLFISIPLLFSLFPETKEFTYTIFGYIWNPVKHILRAVVDYIPNLFQIIIIIVCFRYIIKLIRYFANEIASERLKISGFYPDWALPTFTILRILLYSFMLVMIWPLLPNSDSEIFQGVSVFIGIIVSLGSTSMVGNIMAGLVMTYMRPFRIGDYVRCSDTTGEVVEKTIFVTRIRTLKNELITIPNSSLMGSQISNYTFSASRYGIIVHTKITIGYDQKWQHIRDLLLQAADKTEGIKKHPKPFVGVTALNDSYVEYEINGYTERHKSLPAVYSALHSNILDTMHKAGVEIMSPTIFATRPDIPLQIPPEEMIPDEQKI